MTSITADGRCNPFNFHAIDSQQPTFSYIHLENGLSPRFEDPNIGRVPLLPELEINGKKISFLMVDQDYALCYENKYIFKLTDFFKTISLPTHLDKVLLEKIAIIAGYLSQGGEYIKESAKLHGNTLKYLTKVAGKPSCCQVALPFSQKKTETPCSQTPKIDKYKLGK